MTTVVKKNCHKTLAMSFEFSPSSWFSKVKMKWPVRACQEESFTAQRARRESLCFSQYLISKAFRTTINYTSLCLCKRNWKYCAQISVTGQASVWRRLGCRSFAMNISTLLFYRAVKSMNWGQGISGRTGCAETPAEPTHTAAALWFEDPQPSPLT